MIQKNHPLKKHNTFGIDVKANTFITFNSEIQAQDYLKSKIPAKENILILGGGSNILFTGNYQGIVLHPGFDEIKVVKADNKQVCIYAEAGIEWDGLVEWAVANNMGGLENLSGIPGNVGAAPIQNIGAYGAEVSDVINRVFALSTDDGSKRVFSKQECSFGYRNSIFKGELKNQYMITAVEFMLNNSPGNFNLTYGNLEQEILKYGAPSLKSVRKAVTEIRKDKLPDPAYKGNAGSFFKNPVISKDRFVDLKSRFNDIPSWKLGDNSYKIPAAWLIEKAGWKGRKYGRTAVHSRQALVLVNDNNASGSEILELSNLIIDDVKDKTGIVLSREVNVV
ncbi:MAG: UDP-N-acetylmuramate dehydrogenase [Bacteroidales bacterium]|nr:UDP-N-acetylmuramate dehydrogenase [Bacteroidales bacterium]